MKNINNFINEKLDDNKFTYVTKFELAIDVPVADANDYLQEDDMCAYLKDNIDDNPNKTTIKPDDLVSLTWAMVGYNSSHTGKITLVTTREFTEKELDFVSNYVKGQNSDGLGEGFEQTFEVDNNQRNYNHNQHNYNYVDDEEDETDDGYMEMASFDWKTNKYKFTKK